MCSDSPTLLPPVVALSPRVKRGHWGAGESMASLSSVFLVQGGVTAKGNVFLGVASPRLLLAFTRGRSISSSLCLPATHVLRELARLMKMVTSAESPLNATNLSLKGFQLDLGKDTLPTQNTFEKGEKEKLFLSNNIHRMAQSLYIQPNIPPGSNYPIL